MMLKRTASALLVVCFMSSSASADFYVEQTGAIEPTGSWLAPLFAFSSSPIDLIGAQITSGDPFSMPTAFQDFSAAGWSQEMNDGLLASATGPGTNFTTFKLHFSGAITSPLAFDLAAFSGDTFLGSVHAVWNPEAFGPFLLISQGLWSPTRASLLAVPAPSALLLCLLGLGMVGLIRLRFH
ncbi:MAG: hypothetical protein ACE5E1_00325 [Phycisphaerae bacterium]